MTYVINTCASETIGPFKTRAEAQAFLRQRDWGGGVQKLKSPRSFERLSGKPASPAERTLRRAWPIADGVRRYPWEES